MSAQQNCESCLNYRYDEDYDCQVCTVDLDIDEMEQLAHGTFGNCPYFQLDNEYKIVEKQN